jgi:hypothetical protein
MRFQLPAAGIASFMIRRISSSLSSAARKRPELAWARLTNSKISSMREAI